MSCKSCTHKEHCEDAFTTKSQYCNGARQTNADRIRSMTDEELLFFFWGTVDGSGKTVEQWREWLKQEATE